MQYISPVRFFEHLGIATNDISDVKKLKKLVNLEFLSSETGIVEVDGFDYNKQDLLLLLSNEEFEQNWNFHLKIWKDKFLLDLLEKTDFSELPNIDLPFIQKVLAYQNDRAFVHFLSPYFSLVFKNISKNLLNQNEVAQLCFWVQTQVYIEPNDEEVAYGSMRIFFEDSLYFFRNFDKNNYKNKLGEIARWKNYDWNCLLNILPDYLYQYSDAMVRGITHLIVELQYTDRKTCYVISSWLVKVRIPDTDLEQTVQRNHQIFKKRNGSRIRKKVSRVVAALYGLSIFVAFLIGVFSKSSTHSSTNNNVVIGNTVSTNDKVDSTDSYFEEVNYKEFSTIYNFVHSKDSINSSKGLDTIGLSHFPLFFTVYEGILSALQPFKFCNQTNEDLLFVYVSNQKVYSLTMKNNASLYCDASGNSMMNFLIAKTRKIQNELLWANGTQTTALSFHYPTVVREPDDSLPYKVPQIMDKHAQSTYKNIPKIQLKKKNDKYYVFAKGDSVYYLDERKIMEERAKKRKK